MGGGQVEGSIRVAMADGGVETRVPPDHLSAYCPSFQHVVELLGRRWTGAVLRVLLSGPRRFGEIRNQVPGLSDRLLAERLHELEAEGLVQHLSDSEVPVYSLTEQGLALEAALLEIERYADQWMPGDGAPDRPGRIRIWSAS